jgi:hypothetical protein
MLCCAMPRHAVLLLCHTGLRCVMPAMPLCHSFAMPCCAIPATPCQAIMTGVARCLHSFNNCAMPGVHLVQKCSECCLNRGAARAGGSGAQETGPDIVPRQRFQAQAHVQAQDPANHTSGRTMHRHYGPDNTDTDTVAVVHTRAASSTVWAKVHSPLFYSP